MTIGEQLEEMPLLRVAGMPDGSRPLCLVILSIHLPRLPQWLASQPPLPVSRILIADMAPGTPVKAVLPARYGKPVVECGLGALQDKSCEDVVFLFPHEALVRRVSMVIPKIAASKIWLSGEMDQQLGKRQPIADFYAINSNAIEEAGAALANDGDRKVLAARVKAIISGDPGYLPVAAHMEYEHPDIRPARGDVMIDGGVSDMVQAQIKFMDLLGQEGQIHGFEPIPWMARSASATLARYPNYHLHTAGLADRDGEAVFASMRDSSHMGKQAGMESVISRLRSIDSFMADTATGRLDLIKLDVEGAELLALKGAARSITAHKPKLVVCLYHKPADLFEIPTYIQKLDVGYEMRVAHSSCGFTDTILYARAR